VVSSFLAPSNYLTSYPAFFVFLLYFPVTYGKIWAKGCGFMSEIPTINIPDSAVELASEVYEDGLQSTVKESSKVVSRIPKLINAALAPLDNWILQREYNVERTKQLLHEKLKNVDPDKITTPEAHVAIPAFQAISYSIDSEELRNMYANLLAKSIYADTKDLVHPSFVEIIKQLSPIDARVFSTLASRPAIAIVDLSFKSKSGGFSPLETNIAGLDLADHEVLSMSVDNLEKQNLFKIPKYHYVGDNSLYEEIYNSREYLSLLGKHSTLKGALEPEKKAIFITTIGKCFYNVCIKDDLIPKLSL